MRLSELEPEWITTEGCSPGSYRQVDSIEQAQGVGHACPRCFVDKGCTLIGVHWCIEWSSSRGARPEQTPLPGRWRLVGTSFEDLTLDNEPPETKRSVLFNGPGCGAHFHITNGEVTFC